MEGSTGSGDQRSLRSQSTMFGFGQVVVAVSQRARQLGLVVPGFRSPPGGTGVRAVRRHPQGPPTVLIPYRGRTLYSVAADVVAGILAVNPEAGAYEEELLRAAGFGPASLDPAA